MLKKPKIIVFASGGKTGGGSGFQVLVENSRLGILDAEIVAVVSNHRTGGVYQHSKNLGVPFEYFAPPFTAERYQEIVARHDAQWVSLSGWLKRVLGLDPRRTFNIHPGPLPNFGGQGMFGHHVHEAVIAAFQSGDIKHSAVSMHFVTGRFDQGPIFFCMPVVIRPDDTPDDIGSRVNKYEHAFQSWVTNLVVHEQIHWDGHDRKSLVVPDWWCFS